MKLSLTLLSVLQNQSGVSAESSGEGSEDKYEIESCFSAIAQNSFLQGVGSLNNLCVEIQAAIAQNQINTDGGSIAVSGKYSVTQIEPQMRLTQVAGILAWVMEMADRVNMTIMPILLLRRIISTHFGTDCQH